MAKAYRPLPPAFELWELFDYKPLTGQLVWKQQLSGRGSVGSVAGSRGERGRIDIGINGTLYRGHRLVWCWVTGEDPASKVIDHVNRFPGDNRFWNLRVATQKQNTWNTARHNKLGFKGVSKNRQGTYFSKIRVNGKTHHLGTFATAEEAAAAYAQAASNVYKQFTCTEVKN